MATLQERLNMKRAPLDTWSIREKLFLALTVSRTGDQNWMSVSRSLKPFQENTRPVDWFSQRNCAQQYGLLLENIETPKRKKRHSTSSSAISASGTHSTSTSPNSMFNTDSPTANETPGEHIIRKLTWERVDELQKSILDKKAQYNQLRTEIQLLESGQISEEQLKAMYHEIQEEERQKEIQANEYVHWLNDRENRKMELERAWRPLIRTSSFNTLKRKCPDFDKSDSQQENIPISVSVASVSSAVSTVPATALTTIATTPTTVYTPTVVVVKDREHAHLKPPHASSIQKMTSIPSSTVSSSPLLSSLLKSPTSTANFHSNLFSTLLEKDNSEQQSSSGSKNKHGQSSNSGSRTHTPVIDSQPSTKVVTITTSALRNAILSKSPILISTVASSSSNSETNVSDTKPIVLSASESQLPSLSVSPGLETASKSTQIDKNQHSVADIAPPAVTPLTAVPTTSTLTPKSSLLVKPSVNVPVTTTSSTAVTTVAVNESPQVVSPTIVSIKSPLQPPVLTSISTDVKKPINAEKVADVRPPVQPIEEKPVPISLIGVSNISSSEIHSDVTVEVITVQPNEVSQLNALDGEFTVSSKSTHQTEEELVSKHKLAFQANSVKEEFIEVMEVESTQRPSSVMDEINTPIEASDKNLVLDTGAGTNNDNQERNSIKDVDEKCTPEKVENKENFSHSTTSEIDMTDKSSSIKDEVEENVIESSDMTTPIEKNELSEMEVSLDTKKEGSDNANVKVAETEEVVNVVTETKEEIKICDAENAATNMEIEVETLTVTPISTSKKIKENVAFATETTATKIFTLKNESTPLTEAVEEPIKNKQQSDNVEEPQSLVRRTRLKRDYTRNTKLNRKADFDYEMNFNSDEFDEDSNNESMVAVSSSSSSSSSLKKKESAEAPKQSGDEKKASTTKHSSKCASPWTDDEVSVTSMSTTVTTSAGAKQTTSKRASNKRRVSLDTESNSPSPVLSADDEREIRTVRKSFLLLYNRLVSHKYASHFMKPITDDLAPEYNEIIKQPMDFSTIKKNIDNCCTKTVTDFKRDVLLMFNNAFMYNEPDSDVFLEAAQMQKDCMHMFEQFVESQSQTHISKRETRKSSKSAYKSKK